MPLLRYTALRALFFGVVLYLSLFFGAGWILGLLLAVAISWALSYVLLSRQAEAAARWITARQQARRPGPAPRISRTIDIDEQVEDALIEGEQPPPSSRAQTDGSANSQGDTQQHADNKLQ